MKDFVQLLRTLENALSDDQREKALEKYWHSCTESDRLWSLYLLLQKKVGKRATSVELGTWAMQVSELPQWLFEVARESAGDMAETCALVIGAAQNRQAESLSHWLNLLFDLTTKSPDKRERIISAWQQMDAPERYWFNRLLLGTFRFKIKASILVNALADFTGRPAYVLWHRLWNDWIPAETNWNHLLLETHPLDEIVRPYPFLSFANWESFSKDFSDVKWRTEWQRDGLTVQVILRAEKIFIWSEKGEWWTDQLPDLSALAFTFSEDLILMGKLIGMKAGQILPTKMLEERLSKKVTKKSKEQCPVLFLANDLLEYRGEEMLQKSLEERLTLLETICVDGTLPSCISLADPLTETSEAALAKKLEKAKSHGASGILLRDLLAPYSSATYFWKVPPQKLLAVLLYVTRDERNADRFSEFSFAVWNNREELIPIVKCPFSLSTEDHLELKNYIQHNTIERFGPVISIKAELVFSLSFTDLRISKRRKSGMELLAPKVLAWEKGQAKEAAIALSDLQKILDGNRVGEE